MLSELPDAVKVLIVNAKYSEIFFSRNFAYEPLPVNPRLSAISEV